MPEPDDTTIVKDPPAGDPPPADPKPADPKPADPPPADPKPKSALTGNAPDKYEDFKTPEGTHLTTADLEKIAAHAKERGLSQEDAQKVVDRDSGILKAFSEDQKAAHDKMVNEGEDGLRKHPVIGGEKFDENIAVAKRAIERFADPEMVKFLDESGFGSNPHVVLMMHKIGAAMQDDKFVDGSPGKSAPQKSAADLLFGEGTQIDLSGNEPAK